MSAANQLPHLMTVAEFLDWPTPDGSDRWELVDGVPAAMAPASDRHGAIHAETARLIGNHLAEHRPDCRALVEPGTRPGEHNVRIPVSTAADPWARWRRIMGLSTRRWNSRSPSPSCNWRPLASASLRLVRVAGPV